MKTAYDFLMKLYDDMTNDENRDEQLYSELESTLVTLKNEMDGL
jgi:hypothetical protein